ncbi:hypothetical protein F5884DRAFT_759952 [Xylogone sp. PMI_703]|nr:hypothetical protein F5884DRAFT_759952 [Xylogone sp. PMI_703]
MSSYDRYERSSRRSQGSSRRGTLSFWVPLVVTVTAATIGIAAWIWSERHDEDEDDRRDRPVGPGEPMPDYGRNPDGTPRTGPPSYGDLRQGEIGYGTTPRERPEEPTAYGARMAGALRRTPSPQQFFDTAAKTVSAGVASAGAFIGNALSAIREEDKIAYTDHKTWSEEVEARRPGPVPSRSSGPIEMRSATDSPNLQQKTAPTTGQGRRKTVAVVVSADTHVHDTYDDDSFYETASILSHLPKHVDFSQTRLFILIFSPDLKEHPLDASSQAPGSLSSSFSNIGHEQALPPGKEPEKILTSPTTSGSLAFRAIYGQALGLVEKETMVLPFTTPTGHVQILRHLNPDIVYLQESLAGDNGEIVTNLQSWLRQDVVLVVGADDGHGGLADSESEAEPGPKVEHWWEREDRVGRGRGVVVVEGLRVGDDWARRIEGKE